MGTWRGLLTLACSATPKGSHRVPVKQDSRQGECPGEGMQVGGPGRGTGRTVQKGYGGMCTCRTVRGDRGDPASPHSRSRGRRVPWQDHLRGVTKMVLLLGDPAKRKDRRVPPGP